MTINRIALLSLAFATSSAFAQAPEPTEVSGKIDWVFNYDKAQVMSRNSGKPMFVVFRCER